MTFNREACCGPLADMGARGDGGGVDQSGCVGSGFALDPVTRSLSSRRPGLVMEKRNNGGLDDICRCRVWRNVRLEMNGKLEWQKNMVKKA